VPPLLDAIVAKMLAKSVDERYADAGEVAKDLRECERQLAATATQPPAAATATGGATLASVAPRLVDADAKTMVLAQTVNRTRVEDQSAASAPAPAAEASAPAKGVAPSFDSAEATQRLATLTGAAAPAGSARPTATQAVKSLPPGAKGWRARDWAVVGAAALCGLLAGLLGG